MTTPNHVLHTFVITHLVTQDIPLSVAAGLMAAIPDLIPADETTKGIWGFYEKIHEVDRWWMVVVPPFYMHLLLDKAIHNPIVGGWRKWAIWVEIVLWIAILLYFLGWAGVI